MLQTKPVVVTHSQSLRAIVEKNHCGIWYQDNKPEELAQAICELDDPVHRSVLGKNGRKIVLEKLNWSIDERIPILPGELY